MLRHCFSSRGGLQPSSLILAKSADITGPASSQRLGPATSRAPRTVCSGSMPCSHPNGALPPPPSLHFTSLHSPFLAFPERLCFLRRLSLYPSERNTTTQTNPAAPFSSPGAAGPPPPRPPPLPSQGSAARRTPSYSPPPPPAHHSHIIPAGRDDRHCGLIKLSLSQRWMAP